jgi:CRISPR-associated protein Csb1
MNSQSDYIQFNRRPAAKKETVMTTPINLEEYDKHIESVDWLAETDLPVAITLEELLEPAEGTNAVIFPPTFAVAKTAPHPYQIDVLDKDLTAQEAAKAGLEYNDCQIDGVGSQANRMETRFKDDPLAELVPQITVKLNDGVKANLLDVGHRVADGAVRFSGLREDVTAAIKALRDQANAGPLAKLAPTSLLFGFWDSRPDTTMYKFGRMISSTIRATNVEIVRRSAQYNPTFDPTALGLAEELPEGETEVQETSGKAADGGGARCGFRVREDAAPLKPAKYTRVFRPNTRLRFEDAGNENFAFTFADAVVPDQ